jgi:hypothetical protein
MQMTGMPYGGLVTTKANGVTFEAAVPAEHEVYFAIGDSTQFRAPTMTLTHFGGSTSRIWILGTSLGLHSRP